LLLYYQLIYHYQQLPGTPKNVQFHILPEILAFGSPPIRA